MFVTVQNIMAGRKARRIVAIAVALCIVAVLFASVLLMATHVHHGFGPQPCSTCVKIENCLTVLKTVSLAFALCASLCAFAAFRGGRLRFFADPNRMDRRTPVSQGVRLNI
ncbi:MAG: hypothetical protein LBL63_02690 [Clostridiales Family XIII bacterium]|jgi:hypothetical protein|nr:hypothetical protein [Clostridiales Family XIII bacterium]